MDPSSRRGVLTFSAGTIASICGCSALRGSGPQENEEGAPEITDSRTQTKTEEPLTNLALEQKIEIEPTDGTVPNFGSTVAAGERSILIGAPGRRSDQIISPRGGGVYAYQKDGGQWRKSSLLLPDDVQKNAAFGNALAINSSTALIGSFENSGDSDDPFWAYGAVYVYKYDQNDWVLEAKISGDSISDNIGRFGWDISLNSNTAMIADVSPDSGVSVFNRGGNDWIRETVLTPDNRDEEKTPGISLALSGDMALISTAQFFDVEPGDTGTVHIFKREDSGWQHQTEISQQEKNSIYRFGYSVAIEGETALIGAPYFGDSLTKRGLTYVFRRDGDSWIQQKKLEPDDNNYKMNFGRSLDLQGDIAVVGSRYARNNVDSGRGVGTGAAFVFQRNDGSWNLQTKLVPEDGEEGDGFGSEVFISDEKIIIGAPGIQKNTNSVYIYS